MPPAAEPAAFAAAGTCRPLQPARHSRTALAVAAVSEHRSFAVRNDTAPVTIQTGRSALMLTALTVDK
jgi:dihydroorotase